MTRPVNFTLLAAAETAVATQPAPDVIRWLLLLATIIPLFSSLMVLLFGKGRLAAWFATAAMGGCFVLSLIAALSWRTDMAPIVWQIPWIPIPGKDAGWLYLGLMADSLTIGLVMMVTLISTLVHLYSIGYMEGDKLFERFFAYLSLFTFSMLGIVTANSLMQLFVFWELVGLTSYLLIGFWFHKKGPQLACKKAFVMNRVGDAGFLIGFGILFAKLGGNVLLPFAEGAVDSATGEGLTSLFSGISAVLASESAAAGLTGDAVYSYTNPPMWLTIAGIGLFFGAIGKSAQFPLHTWLPDAMEGPTPVSSIVHSATMVAAGVYLTARIYPMLTPGAHLFIAVIGLVTLVMAALMALVMTDIKKVLAYSTLSQLGYMVLALGAGAYNFALFHLITHAFFKCCLFQCSGSVIHAAHHQQDMRYYGGLMRKMPITAACYAFCTLTISGLGVYAYSIFSGFYSKDGIVAGAFAYGETLSTSLGPWANLFWIGPVAVAYITPFYMARSFFLTFWGQPRDQHLYDHAHEAPKTMWVPQVVLAAMAFLSVPWILPWGTWIDSSHAIMTQTLGVTWLLPDMHEMHYGHGFHMAHLWLLYGLAGVLPIGLAFVIYRNGLGVAEKLAGVPVLAQLHALFQQKFYFDTLYDAFTVTVTKVLARLSAAVDMILVDGLVNLSATVSRLVATLVRGFDERVVDGSVNGAAEMAQAGGEALRGVQTGQIRNYVLAMFVAASVTALLVVTVVLLT